MAQPKTDEVIEAILTGSRSLIAVATRSLGATAEEITLAQYRTLVVLMSRGPQRLVDLADALNVAPSTAGRMCDRLVRKSLVTRHRARVDRRSVKVAITDVGRRVVDEATGRRREFIVEIVRRMPSNRRAAVADAFKEFAAAAGEVPDSNWSIAEDEAPVAWTP